MEAAEDPFQMFGSGEDYDSSPRTPPSRRRDAENGVLTFHPGTEEALLLYVRNGFENGGGDERGTHQKIRRCDQILKLVDDFCLRRHWMMHVGPEKGEALAEFLEESFQTFLQTESRQEPFVIVEVGTYCGYSLIRMAKQLLEMQQRHQETRSDFRIVTCDVSEKNQQVAQNVVAMAGLDDQVSFVRLEGTSPDELSEKVHASVEQAKKKKKPPIDFVFLDHDKDLYLTDLLQLEAAQLVQAGTWVAADNIIFFQLNNYRQHMADLAAKGIVHTKLKDDLLLEYVVQSEKDDELQYSNDKNLERNQETGQAKLPDLELRDGLGM
jgi:catechol O-methyltransferase